MRYWDLLVAAPIEISLMARVWILVVHLPDKSNATAGA